MGEKMSSQQKSRRSFLIDSVSGMGGAGSPPTTPPSLRPKSSCSAAEEFVLAGAEAEEPAQSGEV